MLKIIISCLLAASLPNEKITYQRLTWNDFMEVKQLEDADAETSTSITYYYNFDGKKTSFKAYCYFNKNNSYVAFGKQTAYLLNHEQRHFDITHIYAVKLQKEFNKHSNLTFDESEVIYKKVIAQWDAFQELYDLETDNSQDKDKQKLWDYKISGMIINN